MTMTLNDLIEGRRKQISKRENDIKKDLQEIEFLEKVQIPLKIIGSLKDPKFESDDYSLATNFSLEVNKRDAGGFNCQDGGWDKYEFKVFPLFYFNLNYENKKFRVNIKHEDYEKDENIIVKHFLKGTGWKDFSDQNYYREYHVNQEKVIEYFRKKGVKDYLLENLEERVLELKKLS
ncbi:hypothetical protein KY334_01315 [Candidatus Woesearchaeota archaeon]|nr:hypothetical protein [Candidatus Woesearchaeota archaeon]